MRHVVFKDYFSVTGTGGKMTRSGNSSAFLWTHLGSHTTCPVLGCVVGQTVEPRGPP